MSEDAFHSGPPRPPTQWSQFSALLEKNYLLQLHSRRSWFGVGGWPALAAEVLVPVLFFLVMCIPKHYIKPIPSPLQLFPVHALQSPNWGFTYEGPGSETMTARVLWAPNGSAEAARLVSLLARRAACPADGADKRPSSGSFYRFFSPRPEESVPAACLDAGYCTTHTECHAFLLGSRLVGMASAEEAAAVAVGAPGTVDAVLDLSASPALFPPNSISGSDLLGSQMQPALATGLEWRLREAEAAGGQYTQYRDSGQYTYRYTLRMNHSDVPATREMLNRFDLAPGNQYKRYWWFTNLQALVEGAMLDHAAAAAAQPGGPPPPPALLAAGVKPFPWPALTLDLGATAAAVSFNLLLTYAFLAPTRGAVAAVVQERELHLRQGLRLLGLTDRAYWGSWALTHWSTMALSGLLCALVGLYPFGHSSLLLMLGFYWLVAAALLAFAYVLSSIFSRARVAGTAAAILYALAMLPGYLMPALAPYGGASWVAACLLPPSAISLFAHVLVRLETAQRGLTWGTMGEAVTMEYPFSAATVYLVLLADVLLYVLLLWYLEQVLPSCQAQPRLWYFPFTRAYWAPPADPATLPLLGAPAPRSPGQPPAAGPASGAGAPAPAVRIDHLSKKFRTTDGGVKVAVDDLCLEVYPGQATALLGHNGAGKTTAISILTGLLAPSAGDAYVGGLSVTRDAAALRGRLGVCPQFDVLWPDLSVEQHLRLFAAIKGYPRAARAAVAADAARDVGLCGQLPMPAGQLSGGQRRKLSVALAMVGDPLVIILDEPTSSMDPYSRRFTWEVIRRRAARAAVLLTTHSMEEADLLCGRIAIMSEGRLAAVGSPMDLKRQYGVGYTLTVSLDAAEAPGAGLRLAQLIAGHVPSAEQLTASAGEVCYRLPRSAAGAMPTLLRALEPAAEPGSEPAAEPAVPGVRGYGLSVTTLEEVFLRVTAGAAAEDGADGEAPAGGKPDNYIGADEGQQDEVESMDRSEFVVVNIPAMLFKTGAALWRSQFHGLFTKRALCARRDRIAALVQVVVPVLLVLLALWAGRAGAAAPQQPPLALDRSVALAGRAALLGASPGARDAGRGAALCTLRDAYPGEVLRDSGTTKVLRVPYLEPLGGTLDGYLLDGWYGSSTVYDALFLESLALGSGGDNASVAASFVVLANQTAIHALPVVLNQLHGALLRALTGVASAGIELISHPLPVVHGEPVMRVSEMSGALLLVLCVTMAGSVLSASYALFLVRERSSRSKEVQRIAGASPGAFWAANAAWDGLQFAVTALGMLAVFRAFDLPQFRGARLGAAAALLAAFGAGSLPMTYALQFGFEDEVRAMQRLNSVYFLSGFLGFLAAWILDAIASFAGSAGARSAGAAVDCTLRMLSPHFCLARGVFAVAQCWRDGRPPLPPFTWEVTGRYAAAMVAQGAAYVALTLALEYEVAQRAWHAALCTLHARRARHPPPGSGEAAAPLLGGADTAHPGAAEDEGVRLEREAIQSGRLAPPECAALLVGAAKSYARPGGLPPVHAVRGLWAAVAPRGAFGLLGVNGAGKTTTFRLITGEEAPDAGDAFLWGHSLLTEQGAARRCLGYCPQFNALPPQMTAREVLHMYARLRGMPSRFVRPVAAGLLKRLGLQQYADRAAGSLSGGNQRRLGVAAALVADRPVLLLDEPSSGMDPGARRALWGVIDEEVGVGRSVLLTTHSMEEAEATCGRLGVMAAGALRALGTPQQLKSRYGQGYSMQLRAAPSSSGVAAALVARVAPAAELRARDEAGHLAFWLPRAGLDLPSLFEVLEREGASIGVEDYSLTQTTLEQVFISLAQAEEGAGATAERSATEGAGAAV